MIRSAGALIHAIGCTTPNAYSELCDLSVILIAAKPVEGVGCATIIGALAVAPGRALVNGAFIFPIAIVTDKVYFIDGHFLALCRAGVSDDSRDPLVVVAYGVDAGGTVQDHIVVLAGTTIHIGNVLAGFFATGAAVDAIFSQSLVAKLCCGVAF